MSIIRGIDMRVSLIDEERIVSMDLPKEISGIFFMSYYFKKKTVEKRISIESENGKWIIRGNGNINVYKDNILMNKLSLLPYVTRHIELCGYQKFIELILTPIEERFQSFRMKQDQIRISDNANSDIVYPYLQKSNIVIQSSHSGWKLKADGKVFLNNRRVQEEVLKIGDIIFVNGLKIIWMNQFFQINNPLGLCKINSGTLEAYEKPQEDISNYRAILEEDFVTDLYREEEYFFHTPRLIENIEEVKINIDDPPSPTNIDDNPFWVTIGSGLTMGASAIMSGFAVANNFISGRNWFTIIPSMIMCLSMLVGSLILPRMVRRYQKKKAIHREEYRQKKYKEYIALKEKEIQMALNKQSQILKSNAPTIEECIILVRHNNRRIWSREIGDHDFLSVRLGSGSVPAKVTINASEEKFTLDEDHLVQNIYQLKEYSKMIRDVPITFSFLENPISALICGNYHHFDFISGILLQLCTFHSAAELKLVFLMNHEEEFQFAKFLPHVFSDDRSTRFYAENQTEMQYLSNYLDEILKMRKASTGEKEDEEKEDLEAYKRFDTYYLIITDDFINIRNLPIIDHLLNSKNNYGFSILLLEKSLRKLPKECTTFLEVLEKDGCIFEKNLNQQIPFQLESCPRFDMREISSLLSRIPIALSNQTFSLPTSISFLDMYKVSRIEQLNILNRWKTNNPTMSLKGLIGVHTNGEDFLLDLHEKYHGPHGLIAGSTGSGKSEFIITYVLSMAINYHPDEVQFVLIDYKGGGLAGAFDNPEMGIRIPHIAGTITNLDENNIQRALVSINSELKRRQQIFNEARNLTNESTIDIYKYQKYYREGLLKEPISHLFVVCDEFAELKKEQPEFMSELITTSRIGRSLGVHLILATQKPSGVVNDQIWSNSKFKVCLKVQSRSDSMEVLKRADAASLKETGRFYLQVGYDEYFDIGQSGYSGAKYIPSDKIVKKLDDSVSFIDNVGNRIKIVQDPIRNVVESQGDQLVNIVKYLSDLAKSTLYQPKRLWLEQLPKVIYLGNLIKKYRPVLKKYHLTPIIGEYDDPIHQNQGLLTLDISQTNTLVYGLPDSGIDLFLNTFIFSLITTYAPEELNLYLIDMNSTIYSSYQKAPQIGDSCSMEEQEKIFNLMIMIDAELERRKKLFMECGGNYHSYISQANESLPFITVIINGYELFYETMPKIAEMILPLYRDGLKYGISFVITTGVAGSIRMRIMEYFQKRICFQMANDGDYRTVISQAPRNLKPAKIFGRGLVSMENTAYEFQVASIYEGEKQNEIIQNTLNELQKKYSTKSMKIKVLPKQVTLQDFPNESFSFKHFPIGYDYHLKEPYYYDFSSSVFHCICGNNIQNYQGFIQSIVKIMQQNQIWLQVFDCKGMLQMNDSSVIHDGFDEAIVEMQQKINENITSPQVFIFIQPSALYANLKEDSKLYFDTIMSNMNHYSNVFFLFIDNAKDFQQIQIKDWYYKNVNKNQGIWLGDGVGTQVVIQASMVPFDDKKLYFESMGFAFLNQQYRILKMLTVGDES